MSHALSSGLIFFIRRFSGYIFLIIKYNITMYDTVWDQSIKCQGKSSLWWDSTFIFITDGASELDEINWAEKKRPWDA